MGWLIGIGAAAIFCAAPFAWRAIARWFFGQNGGS
jgi:hypothetical protein